MKILLLFILLISNSVFANIEVNSVGLFIYEGDREGTLYVTNTSNQEVLVYAKEEIEETMKISGESLFYVSPPISKIKPQGKQLIRVILKKKNFKSQKLGRILIQEVPYISDPNANIVAFTKSYNLPALAHPNKLIEDFEPWKKAKLTNEKEQLKLINDSNYLIKVMPTYKCKTSNNVTTIGLDSPYIMPYTKININSECEHISVLPVSNEGKILESYTISKS